MPRRGENIRKRKDGRWEARIRKSNGKIQSVYAQSYYLLKDKLKNTEEKFQDDLFSTDILFKDIYNEWLNESQLKNKQSTIAMYTCISEKHILPHFGKMKLCDIEKSDINKFIGTKIFENKLEDKTVRDICCIFMQIIKYAEKQGYIFNFNCDISMPKVQRKELDVLSSQEQKDLVGTIKGNITNENIGILLSLFTGLRLGEICALTWKDIDLNVGTISVTKTMQRISEYNELSKSKTKIITDAPKSQKSIRTIPIPDFLLLELKKLSKGVSSNAYVLTSSETKFIEPRNYQYKFKKYLKEARIRNINFHTLRHTFATRAIEQNMDVKTLSEILGHSTISFTLDRYVHSSFNLKKQNMEKLAVCY